MFDVEYAAHLHRQELLQDAARQRLVRDLLPARPRHRLLAPERTTSGLFTWKVRRTQAVDSTCCPT